MSENQIRSLFDELLENELTQHAHKIGTGKKSIQYLGEIVEHAYKYNPIQGENMRQALDILIPTMYKVPITTDNTSIDEPDVQAIMDACIFAGHYRQTRDLIYLSFKSPSAVQWELSESIIKIKTKDISFFRQLACETQSFLLNSRNVFPPENRNIESLIAQVDYWDNSDLKTQEIVRLLEQEAEIKIQHFFSYIPSDSTVDIGGFTYHDFLNVYKSTLIVSLYERRWAKLHDEPSVITYQEDALIEMHASNANISKTTCAKILKELSEASRGTFNYIKESKEYLLFPFSYSVIDQIAEILKLFAKKNEGGFSAGCATIIGNSLVKKVSSYFLKYPNFRVLTDVNLQKFDKKLPDMDVVAFSYEPTFGFQFYICEVKNNLPASWIKEHLKLSDHKGALQKAKSQILNLQEFIQTPECLSLLKGMIHDQFKGLDFDKYFPTGFMATINFLVVTNQNIGVLLNDNDLKIVNNDILRHLINSSDGDTIYIKYHLDNLNYLIDQSYKLISDTFSLGKYQIVYDISSLEKTIAFPPNQYLSKNMLERLEQDGISEDYRFIDWFMDKMGNQK